MSLKVGFASKRQHDPKWIVDLHLRENHFKTGYVHEETPDDFIYQGIDTFYEVLERDKSKQEQSHILQYQKEIRDKVKNYRSMELDILERIAKDREEKEARATTKEVLRSKTPSVGTSSDLDKGKAPMGENPQVSMEQEVRDYLQTSEQIKQRLNKLTSALNTQEVATSHPIEDAQMTVVNDNIQSVLA